MDSVIITIILKITYIFFKEINEHELTILFEYILVNLYD